MAAVWVTEIERRFGFLGYRPFAGRGGITIYKKTSSAISPKI